MDLVPAQYAEASASTAVSAAVSAPAASAAGSGAGPCGLAPREQETLRHIAAGCTYAQTARHMGLSTHTVDAYLRRIRAKLGISSTAELTRLAISLGL
ncbi:helix-turn-helix transcriptional regulator [Streptomyces sp. NPDC002133]|uniref:response regulator transcription factor n=1 Tax=Streptomyces sp. NPDC002133 TaxID=3154409 RepID=UPI00332BA01B